ncbi:hypothetical protein [Vibrio metschnikovii]|uniref:Pilus assembly protein n=1 Tax=Vibrio metschnikovii TaxID=28172 RepID=A0A9X0RAQ6_VIBME|nr:hypothetical protein [Vibrio metschnikovii]MBC5851365.1 hypothetical protein [Vibrio metschnikovii]
MRNIKRSLIATALILSSAAASASTSFLVAPGRLEFDIDKPLTKTFIVTNTGSEQIRLEIDPQYLEIGEEGLRAGEHIKDGVADIENIESHIRVAPKVLNLKPGQRRDVKVRIVSKQEDAGDYRSHIIVKMKENAAQASVGTETEGVNMNLDIKFETAIAVYGRKGDIVTDYAMNCGKGAIEIKNNSPYKLDGEFKVGDEIRNTTVLRESKRTMKFASGDTVTFTPVDAPAKSKTCTVL